MTSLSFSAYPTNQQKLPQQPSIASVLFDKADVDASVDSRDLRYFKTLAVLPPQNRLLTEEERQSIHTSRVVQTALKRFQPIQPMNAQTIQNDTPLVNFLASPHAKKNILVSGLSIFMASLGLGLGIVNAKEKKEMKLLHEVFKTSLWMLGGTGIGYLYGQFLGASLDSNQRWVNNWMMTLIGMTSPQTPIQEANKRLQQRTGETIQTVLAGRTQEEIDRLHIYDAGSVRYV
jgi:hypothetical protein